MDLAPLGTGTSSLANASGAFCLGQLDGCFGVAGASCTSITETGVPPSSPLVVNIPADLNLAATFCVPSLGTAIVNQAMGLPGPGAISEGYRITLNP